jgi:nitrite reductase/ring-hydroxylating ferredoxin subunit
MFLRRRDLMVGLFGAAISFISGPADAAVVPKLKCTRVGQTVIYRNQKFKCVKKSGKLVWGKGVPVPVKSASPKPAASASPTPAATSASPTPTSSPNQSQIKLASSSEIPIGTVKVFQAGRTTGLVAPIVLIRDSAGLRALSAECPHRGYLVKDNGGGELLCPAHYSLFSAKDGELLRGPATSGLSGYVVTETGGEIFLTL